MSPRAGGAPLQTEGEGLLPAGLVPPTGLGSQAIRTARSGPSTRRTMEEGVSMPQGARVEFLALTPVETLAALRT
jgi:hypothetical protein